MAKPGVKEAKERKKIEREQRTAALGEKLRYVGNKREARKNVKARRAQLHTEWPDESCDVFE